MMRKVSVFLVVMFSLVAWGEQPLKPHPESGRVPAPVMSAGGADWLERPSRIQEEKPEILLDAMELKPSDVVADIGVGTGFFARRIARRIGPEGKVLGVDIQQEMLDALAHECEREGIENVEPILGEFDDPKLPEKSADWILLVDTYHEFEDPVTMLEHMRRALKDDGKVALVEYRLLGPTAQHIKKEHRMSVKQVLAEWHPAGFELVDLVEELPSQHLFIFQKDPDRK